MYIYIYTNIYTYISINIYVYMYMYIFMYLPNFSLWQADARIAELELEAASRFESAKAFNLKP